jgi:hypothetical protein
MPSNRVVLLPQEPFLWTGNWKPSIVATLLQWCRLTYDVNDTYGDLYRRADLFHTGTETLFRCYILRSGGLDALCAFPPTPPHFAFSQKCKTKLQWLRILSVIFKIQSILPHIQNISGGGCIGGCVCCYGCCGVVGGCCLFCKTLKFP